MAGRTGAAFTAQLGTMKVLATAASAWNRGRGS